MSRRSSNRLSALLCAALCVCAGAAMAERADRDKPVRIEADQVSIDDARQVAIFTGNVAITQGTLAISGEQVVANQGPQGLEHGTVTGRLAAFRQKREGLDEYVEGWATRIEYDAVTGVMDMYGQAHLKRGQDDVRGEHISYDPRSEIFKVFGAPPPTTQAQVPSSEKPPRVIVVIQPHPASAVAPSEPLPTKLDTRLINPENKR